MTVSPRFLYFLFPLKQKEEPPMRFLSVYVLNRPGGTAELCGKHIGMSAGNHAHAHGHAHFHHHAAHLLHEVLLPSSKLLMWAL